MTAELLHLHQRLVVMPDDGCRSVVELIDTAREQLLLKQFKLQSEAIEQALQRAPAAIAGTMRPLPGCRQRASRPPGPPMPSRSPTRSQW
jgi:hypothetical protein